MPVRERIVIDDDDQFGRVTVVREPAPDLVVWRPEGDDELQTAAVEYLPPRAA